MPRNGAGTYTLPAGNPVVAGTTIDTTWANPTMTDIASEVTNSLDRSGRGAMLAALQAFDGAVGAPGVTWATETSMGVYRIGAAQMGVSVSGTLVSKWSAAQFSQVLGVVGAPSWAFIGDLSTGWWSPAAATQAWSITGVEKMRLNANGLGVGQAATATFPVDVLGTVRSIGGELTSGYAFRALNSTGNGGGGLFAVAGASAGITITGDAGPITFTAVGGQRGVLNASGLFVTAPDASTGLTALSGAANKYTGVSVGRVAAEASLGVVGQINNFFNGTVVGDIVLQGSTGVMYIGNTGAAGVAIVSNNLSRLVVDSLGHVYGTALHNNASSPAGAANQYLASGTYTPTLTNVLNAPAPVSQKCLWTRTGNVVHVSGAITTGALSAGAATTTTIGISLPLASNLASTGDLSGVCSQGSTSFTGVVVGQDSANDRAQISFIANATGSATISFELDYEVL